MKHFKWVLLLLLVFLLQACNNVNITHEQVFNELELAYQTGDDETNVTGNITLPISSLESEWVDLVWLSSNETYAKIEGNQIIITRPTEANIEINITAEVTIGEDVESKVFTFTIIKAEETIKKTYNVIVVDHDGENTYPIEENTQISLQDRTRPGYEFGGYYLDNLYVTPWDDRPITQTTVLYVKWTEIVVIDEVAPIINGTKDINITIGDDIDYLLGVSVYDENDEIIAIDVDDSAVNLEQAGSYPLIYKAEDKAGNQTEITVLVHVSEKVSQINFIETFDSISNGGSSYTDGTFTSQGITWTYQGMRGDLELHGKALTFGASSNNYLRAEMTGGISSFKVDMAPQFSGSNEREVSLYVNQVLIETFYVSSTQTTYETTLDVTGDYLLELRNTGSERVTIDSISIGYESLSNDMKAINQDIEGFMLPSYVMIESTHNFEHVGPNGSSISYKFTDPSNPNNGLINLETGLIQMPISDQVTVSVDITFSKGEESKTVSKTMVLGEGAPIMIDLATQQSGYVITQGSLTGYIIRDTYVEAFFQDSSDALAAIIDLNQLDQLTIGYNYKLKGNMDGLKDTLTVSSLEKGYERIINPTYVTPVLKASDFAKYVFVKGLVQTDYITGNLVIVNADQTIQITDFTNDSLFEGIVLGQEVLLNGLVYKQGSTYAVAVTKATAFEVRPFDIINIANYVMEAYGFSTMTTLEGDINLSNNRHAFDLNIAFSSSNQNVLSNTGIFNRPTEDTTIILSFDIIKDDTVIYESQILLNVFAGADYEGYYQSLSGLSGSALINELRDLIVHTGRSTGSTSEVMAVDRVGSSYYLIYEDLGAYGNREHVWPNSKLGSVKYDLHNLRAARVSTNSSRSNYPFAEDNKPFTGSQPYQKIGSTWYPGDEHIGDVARIVFYISIRENLPISRVGNVDMFLDWHELDPVNDFERTRNDRIYDIQSNRNPFIDHPELVEAYFGAQNQSLSMDSEIIVTDYVHIDIPVFDHRIYQF